MMEKNDMKMQLRVFHVERGRSVYFDIAIALQSLDVLKAQIEQACCIPVKEQILLMNGGHTVEGIKRLCENKENTDLIYVISRELLKQKSPDLTCDEYAIPDVDLSERVTTCYNMPIAYDTIVQRAYLGQKFHELAKELAQIIERLIDDQHWQQQAWFAVMANFDDTCKDFETRSELFFKQVEIYQANMPKYKEQLENFDKNLELLSKIPVLPVLIQLKENTEALTVTGSPSSEGSSVSVSKNIKQIGYRKSKCMSLLDWIADKDKSFSLKEIAIKCNQLLMELDDKRITRLKDKYNTAMKTCDNPQLKKFESLADRLSSLEQFRASTTLYVSKQRDIDTLFSRNQAGANSLKDVSVLPDICNSHKPQLIFLLQNHEKLKDMKNKCISSKMELCDNLHRRLAMVLTIENVIQETDCSLTAYGMKLNELEYYAKLLEQVDKAPQIYFTFVNEVVRRRNFSDSFLKWGSALSTNLHQVLTEETERRIEFQNQFDHHFISSMFIGLHDVPPKYATEPPLDFDTELPAVTIDDINMLKSEVPDLSETITLPDLSVESKFFQLNKDTIYEEKGVGDDLVCPVDDAKTIDRVSLRPSDSQLSAASSHITHPHLKDIDRGFESETDTEEFEKVCQSPVELQFNSKRTDLITTKAATLDASTLTEVGDHRVCTLVHSPIPPKKPPRAFTRITVASTHKSPSPPFTKTRHDECLVIRSLRFDMNSHAVSDISDSISKHSFDQAGLSEGVKITDVACVCSAEIVSTSSLTSNTAQMSYNRSTCSSFTQLCCRSLDATNYCSKCSNVHVSQTVIPPQTIFEQTSLPNSFTGKITDSLTRQSTYGQLSRSMSPKCEASVTESAIAAGSVGAAVSEPDESPISPSPSVQSQGHQQFAPEFVTTEYYIDESLPSSLSTEGGALLVPHADLLRQLDDSNNVVALLQDNLNTAKNEIDRLKSNLVQVSQLSKNAIGLLRAELAAIKNDAASANEDFKIDCDIIIKTWERFQLECSNQEREKIQRLTVDHELEMNDVKNLAIAKDDEIRSLKHEKIETECSYNRKLEEKTLKLEEAQKIYEENVEKCCELEKQIEEIKIENERSENLLKEQMTREHQNELESLRSRFRLMTVTNMERSPSDTSLERIERLDVIELVNHESIIAQLKENYYLEKVEAVKNAVEEEKSRWSTKLKDELQRQQIEFELQKQLIISEATRRIIDEKDRQIESLYRENRKFKEMIQQLTETNKTVDSNCTVQPLIEKVEALEQDKCRLEVELSMERSRKLMAHEMSTSVALFSNQEMASPPRRDVSTSTESMSSSRPRKMLTSSQVQLIQTHHVNLSSCKEGDRVLIVFDPSLKNYVLVNEYSSTLYFLNSDCIGPLGLRPIDQATRKCTVIGEVTDKEYCIAKKQGNRYNVPQGTRFYRVKVKPLTRDRSRTDSVNSTQSVASSGPSSVETGSVDSKRSSSLTRSSIYETHGLGLDLTVLSQSTDSVPDQGNSNISAGESMDSSTASTITDPVQMQNQSSGETVMNKAPFMYHSIGSHPDIVTGVHRENLQVLLSQSDYSKTAVAVVSRLFSNAGLVDFSRPIDHSLYQSFGQPASSSSGSYHSVEPVPTVSSPADEIDAGSKR